MKSKFALAAVTLGLSIITAGSAQASPVSFQCITNTSAVNCATGEDQLSMTITGPAAGQALFTFTNAGPYASSITDLYWESGNLLQAMLNANYTSTGTVSFSQGASPSNLPGWNNATPAFHATKGLTADSDTPVVANGVNPGESLGVLFSLQSGMSYTDVLTALDNGSMRVGIHVQAFSTSSSESFINAQTVPVPTAAWLLGSGLLGLVGVARRQS